MKNCYHLQFFFMIFILTTLFACRVDYATLEEPQPSWIADAVFYQIFPERFRNGDNTNDPDKKSLYGSYPHDTTSEWHLSPWTSDWYKLQPWEKANGKGFAYNAQRRRYGGDLEGIIEKLDYLKDLGINAIYLNPVFESPSLHKYDATTYIHIDDNFGPNPQIDQRIIQGEDPSDPKTWRWTSADSLFLKLIREAHLRNIRIIIDGVFNHVGITHWAFLDVRKNGPKSKFKDWFTILSWDDPSTPQDEFKYKGWNNVAELPELKEDANGLIPPIRDHIFSVVERWMDPNQDGDPSDGIDGWRLDVAEMIHHNFWKDFRIKVKTVNPDAYITGEIFWDDWKNNKLMNPAPWLKGDEFDGVMNYQWAALVTNYFIDKKNKISTASFLKRLAELDKRYDYRFRFQLLNLMDSHDTDRLASNIVNPDLFYDKRVSPFDNPEYDVRKPNADEWQKLKLIALFQFTCQGAPMIYYGTESGMWGADDPDCRKPMVWDDMVYEPERANISKKPRPVDTVAFDYDLFEYYKKLIHLRRKEIALRRGSLKVLYGNNEKDVFAFTRTHADDEILVVINNSDQNQAIEIKMNKKAQWKNLLTDEVVYQKELQLPLTVKKKAGLILKRI
ncbi:MAG: alpha-amylase [Calditrichaeota bacterium]|nr:alpha-amylase [Calditrichota bacterium]